MNLNLNELGDIAGIIESLAVCIATAFAIRGFNSWRKETAWKRKFELAEEVLANFYDVRERIERIRSPAGFWGEGKSRPKKDKETQEESQQLDNAYIIFERYNREEEPFINLNRLKFRFLVNFGKEYAKSFDEINSIINNIFWAYHKYNFPRKRKGNIDDLSLQKEIEESLALEKIFWRALRDEPDGIKERVEKAVATIETVCNKLLSTKQGKRYFRLKNK